MSEITAAKVKALLERITQGDWWVDTSRITYLVAVDDADAVCKLICNDPSKHKDNADFIAASPDIARAFIAKCEEVDRLIDEESRHVLEKSIHKNAATILREENERLQNMLNCLNGNMASMQQTNEAMGKRLLSMQTIIEKQRDVLNVAMDDINIGAGYLSVSTEFAIKEALALTQQQTNDGDVK